MSTHSRILRVLTRRGILRLLACCVIALVGHAFPLQAEEHKSFVVFDGLLYAGKPDMAQYGIQPISIAYAGQFGRDWFKTSTHMPDKDAVQRVAREAKSKADHVVIDIEHWPLTGDPVEVEHSLSKYLTVLQWFKEAAPGLVTGYYGAPPLRDYWRAIRPPASKEWQALTNDNARLQSLADSVDVLFPSLYTFYTDQGAWVRYVYGQIAQARQCANGKPIYVFLMPQYHESNRALAGTYLPVDYWRLQLETAKQYADGVVLWGGWGKNNRPAQWDEEAAWWKMTKEFLKTIQDPKLPPNPQGQ